MTTASLPVRYEIENTGTTASASTMKQVCISIISNGGYFKSTNTHSVIRPNTTIATTLYPLIAVRMTSGKTDSVIVPSLFALFPTTADDYEYSVTRNPTSITGGSWVADSSGNVEYNISATAMEGGERLLEGFFSSTNQSNVGEKSDIVNLALQLGRTNADTPVSDVLVLSAKVTSGTGGVKSSLGWFDLL
jgi:hypothetical protein